MRSQAAHRKMLSPACCDTIFTLSEKDIKIQGAVLYSKNNLFSNSSSIKLCCKLILAYLFLIVKKIRQKSPGLKPRAFLDLREAFHFLFSGSRPDFVCKNPPKQRFGGFLVPLTGLEPVWYCYRGILSYCFRAEIGCVSYPCQTLYGQNHNSHSEIQRDQIHHERSLCTV